MKSTFQNIAILLAGGEGKRVGGDIPKQLRTLPDGRTVLQTCIDTFRLCPVINDIWVVMHHDWLSYVPAGVHAIEGGKERWESSFRAIQAICEHYQENVNVWIHDAARPFVSQALLQRIREAIAKYEAVSVAIPVTDTIYQVQSPTLSPSATENLTLQSVPLRSTMMRAQTPQVFRLPLIKKAFDLAVAATNDIQVTDDAGIVLRYMPHIAIHIIPGEEANRKITFQEDLL
ncbi:MAG: 2-C-methyl-D-erythritol 4-phosphate cytidylyltransferase [Paludibacteraceae bacterium]|nr:2-C-methyl-D-erythritol 4-phosphate cytidylyltransferase [Paludibacteraceae bacterium]